MDRSNKARMMAAAFAVFVFVFFVTKDFSVRKINREELQGSVVYANVTKTLEASPEAQLGSTPSPTPEVKASIEPISNSGYCLNVPVIFYHHIQPLSEAQEQGHAQFTVDSGIFDSQMAYLSGNGYTAISAGQLVDALQAKSGLPPKPVVITIDDGYSDIYTYAYPILQKYHLTASLAIPTGLLENSGYMTWDQLNQMKGSGLVFSYNHSWSHYSLPGSDSSKMEYEISTAKSQLSSQLGVNSNVFFYPYGNTDGAAIAQLQRDGYAAAFTTYPGFTQCDSFLMSLHRTRIGNSPLASYGL